MFIWVIFCRFPKDSYELVNASISEMLLFTVAPDIHSFMLFQPFLCVSKRLIYLVLMLRINSVYLSDFFGALLSSYNSFHTFFPFPFQFSGDMLNIICIRKAT
jgi:hypothetical protein